MVFIHNLDILYLNDWQASNLEYQSIYGLTLNIFIQ